MYILLSLEKANITTVGCERMQENIEIGGGEGKESEKEKNEIK